MLDSVDDALQSSLLDQIQSLIRSINTDVALLLAESGEIKRSVEGPDTGSIICNHSTNLKRLSSSLSLSFSLCGVCACLCAGVQMCEHVCEDYQLNRIT